MKTSNRRNYHAHHGSKRRKLPQHTHSHGSHAFTHTLTSTQLQPRGAKHQLSYSFSVRAGFFHVSIIHQPLTWTTGSLTCVHDHSCACIYTPTVSQHNLLDLYRLNGFLVLLMGFKPSTFDINYNKYTIKFLNKSLQYCPCVQQHIKPGHAGSIDTFSSDFFIQENRQMFNFFSTNVIKK